MNATNMNLNRDLTSDLNRDFSGKSATANGYGPISSINSEHQKSTSIKSIKKPIEQLNALFLDYEMALDAAANAQKDVVIVMRAHLRGEGTLPPAQMQAAANDLWYCAARKKEMLEEFYTRHVQ